MRRRAGSEERLAHNPQGNLSGPVPTETLALCAPEGCGGEAAPRGAARCPVEELQPFGHVSNFFTAPPATPTKLSRGAAAASA